MFLIIKDARTFFDPEHRKETPCVIGKYLVHSLLFGFLVLLILYPVALFFLTTDYLWAFSVFYLLVQTIPLVIFMLSCSCVATLHFLTSTFSYWLMAAVHILDSIIMIAFSIVVTVIWLVYANTFFWELFLASLLPGLFSFFNGVICIGMGVGELSRFRYRRRFNDYVPDLDIKMSSPQTSRNFTTTSTESLLPSSKNASTPKDKKQLSVNDILGLSTDELDLEDIEMQPAQNTSETTKKGEDDEASQIIRDKDVPPEMRVDWKRYMKKKGVQPTKEMFDRFVDAHEESMSRASSRASSPNVVTSGRNPDGLDSDAESDGSINVFDDIVSDNNKTPQVPPKLKKSVPAYNESVSNLKSSSKLKTTPSSRKLTSSSSPQRITSKRRLLEPSQSSRNLLTSARYVQNVSEKERKRREFEQKEAAGKDWKRFVKHEEKKGRVATWENFQKYNLVSTPFANNQKKGSANKIAVLSKIKMRFGSKLDTDTLKILQELSEKYELPLKQVKKLHADLVKKYGQEMTRKQIKASLNASKVSRNMLNSIMRMADDDGDGTVTVAEWMRIMFRFRYGTEKDRFAAAFSVFDYDGSREMEFQELYSMVSAFASTDISKSQKKALTARIFRQMDVDGSGSVEQDEFVEFASNDPELRKLLTQMTNNIDLR